MAAAARKMNWLAIWISAGVVVVIAAVATLAVWMNNQALALAESPATAVVDEETGAITLGEGENVLEEYVDFMCPYCGRYFNTYGEEVAEEIEAGNLTLEIHPISILDRASQNSMYSTRAANAAYCVAEDSPDAVYPFMDALFVNQPSEGSEGLSDEELLDYAEQAGASDAVEACVTGGEYNDFVAARTQETPPDPASGSISTPTVILNDQRVALTWDPEADILSQLQ